MHEAKNTKHPRSLRAKELLIAAAVCTLSAIGLPAVAHADAPTDVAPATQPAGDQPGAAADEPHVISSGLDAKGNGITLIVNQSRRITTAVPVRAVDVTQPEVVGARVINPQEIILTARKPGSAQLVLWDDLHRSVTVDVMVDADLKALKAELERDLPDVHVEISSANGTVVLRGHVPNVETSDKIVQIATPYALKPTNIVNLLEISGGQQITLQVRFAEVSKDAISELGINFGIAGSGGFGANVIGGISPLTITTLPNTVTPALGVGAPGTNISGFAQLTAGKTPFDFFISAMQQNNLLRTLSEPNLTVLSGSQASFLAGGEFPYPVPQSGGAGGAPAITIQYKQYGVRLNFSPVVMGNGRIRLHIQPEVSDLDYTHALSIEGFIIPALTTRTADTIVELGEGQTLSMAGLLDTRINATNTAIPVLGEIPVLGALFRSVRYERTETELVVLVTPLLSAPMNPNQVPAMPGERWRYPTPGSLYLNGDMGGPLIDSAHAPRTTPPPQFQGTYGFAPATPTAANGGK